MSEVKSYMWNITLLDRWSENRCYVVHVQLYKEREHDWVSKEIYIVLNLKFSRLVVNTGLQGLEGRQNLWLVSVGVKGRDCGRGHGCKISQRETNTHFELNSACQKQRDKEGRERKTEWNIHSSSFFKYSLSHSAYVSELLEKFSIRTCTSSFLCHV